MLDVLCMLASGYLLYLLDENHPLLENSVPTYIVLCERCESKKVELYGIESSLL
jgi:hypothetical protein